MLKFFICGLINKKVGMEGLLCLREAPKFLIFADWVPNLLYYSHIPTAIISLLLGIFIIFRDRKPLANKFLFVIFLLFTCWSFLDLITWGHNSSYWIMLAWSLLILVEPLIFVLSLYFIKAFFAKKYPKTTEQILMLLAFLPVLVFLPTEHNLSSITLDAECLATEGFISTYYVYSLEIFFLLWIIVFSIRNSFSFRFWKDRKKALLLRLGLILFLSLFLAGNILGSSTLDWEMSQYGLFGMPIFAGLLTHLIVRYKVFNIRLISAQALVVALILLIGSELFFVESVTNKILVLITLALSIGFGYWLVRSVEEEIKKKNELKDLTEKLGIAYERLHKLDRAKSEFLSIASHQLRTPLTSIKGFTSLLLEGVYGKISRNIQGVLEKVFLSNERLIKLVEDLLNISRIESGRLSFDFKKEDVQALVRSVVDSMRLPAKAKKLKINFIPSKEPIEKVVIDKAKLTEVVSNLIDNSIKYTKKGVVSISVIDCGETIKIIVADTGIGIAKDEIEYIFDKFQRGDDINRMQTDGVGLGLYVCRKMVDAHQGKIWAESKGVGKGSRFIVELKKNFIPKDG